MILNISINPHLLVQVHGIHSGYGCSLQGSHLPLQLHELSVHFHEMERIVPGPGSQSRQHQWRLVRRFLLHLCGFAERNHGRVLLSPFVVHVPKARFAVSQGKKVSIIRISLNKHSDLVANIIGCYLLII